ncbi:MAG: alpha/beta hydrolase [Cyanobacteria bacterium J06621_8]
MNSIWLDYYAHFNYLRQQDVRDGCHPWLMTHENNKRSIVLIHGLTDSPYFMQAIGQYFHEELNFNVFIPLLQAHGLKKPNGMAGVSLEKWKENVEFAVDEAKKMGETVSIGGLSTGGTLSVYMATNQPEDINGGIFLFSAALDIANIAGDLIEGDLVEFVARSFLVNLVDFYEDRKGNLIGDNPYRYSRMDTGGAQQLSRLIKEVDQLTGKLGEKSPLLQPLFVAHSECDKTADIEGVEELIVKAKEGRCDFYRMGKHFNISHASVVLKEPVKADNGSPLEPANPFFDEMMAAIKVFSEKHLSVS